MVLSTLIPIMTTAAVQGLILKVGEDCDEEGNGDDQNDGVHLVRYNGEAGVGRSALAPRAMLGLMCPRTVSMRMERILTESFVLCDINFVLQAHLPRCSCL